MTPAEVKDALDRCPRDLWPLLRWLISGCVPSADDERARNGLA